jgi:FkbM family methyltransferase
VRSLRRLPGTVKRALNRPGGRWLLGVVLSVAFSMLDRRRCRVRWTGSAWAYHYDGQVLLSDQLLRPSTTFDADLDIFLWDYTPSPGDVILDIGAGTGTEAVRLARAIGPTGRIVAVEAHPRTAAILADAGPANGLTTVTVLAAAVADEVGTVQINDEVDDPGTNTLFADGSIEVEATTVDALVDLLGLDHVDFLKMNIEGAERLAILGMTESIHRIDRLAISCHDFLGTEWGATSTLVRAWLEEQGFTIRTRPDDPRPWARHYLYATAPARVPVG